MSIGQAGHSAAKGDEPTRVPPSACDAEAAGPRGAGCRHSPGEGHAATHGRARYEAVCSAITPGTAGLADARDLKRRRQGGSVSVGRFARCQRYVYLDRALARALELDQHDALELT